MSEFAYTLRHLNLIPSNDLVDVDTNHSVLAAFSRLPRFLKPFLVHELFDGDRMSKLALV